MVNRDDPRRVTWRDPRRVIVLFEARQEPFAVGDERHLLSNDRMPAEDRVGPGALSPALTRDMW